ncbi:MAG TPA: type II toxin-antitoxin system RelE/ParE family toxin [Candidatus Pacearchaeota archaeon]|nr:plasmid stabilization system protein [archaeon BMS3Abin17]HDK42011.1 type II toxin-antitoxin system RelE/ParE family toxin [Candidatus Pacearchaeota archaeon]HDZ60767.1 type II toxin-antitoxin system RelE/ParE family toxin [Candidatus Pacearchaeota archaeon]
MTYEIIWDEQARNFLRKLEKKESLRIIKKINSIVENPMHFLETLVDINSYKLRVGNYRALIDIDKKNKSFSILFIGHRKNIYKHLRNFKDK